MMPPKIKAVSAREPYFLLVEFDNRQWRRYDFSPLLSRQMFAPLKNPALFRAAKVECGGAAVSWSDDIDISENELWTNGESAPPAPPFR